MLAQWAGIVACKPVFNAAKQYFWSNSEGAEHFVYCYVLPILLLGKAALSRKGNGNARGFWFGYVCPCQAERDFTLENACYVGKMTGQFLCKEKYYSTIQERAGIPSKHNEILCRYLEQRSYFKIPYKDLMWRSPINTLYK